MIFSSSNFHDGVEDIVSTNWRRTNTPWAGYYIRTDADYGQCGKVEVTLKRGTGDPWTPAPLEQSWDSCRWG
jgi:hypothetical protein